MKYKKIDEIIQSSQHLIVLQADNPDGDSVGSSLALEAIFSEMGKQVTLVCAIDIPAHLRYLQGWDRIQKEVPHNFDATIIVDNSTDTLFETIEGRESFAWIKTKPVVVIDHHTSSQGISFATESIIEPVVATSELIYNIANECNWPLPIDACEMMAVSIMSDSLGLTTDATTAESYRVMANLVEKGVDVAKLDAARRELSKKEPELLPYKGELLRRVILSLNGKIASVVIPWKEIEKYSPIYNPTMLVMEDMRSTVGVEIAIGYKVYNDGKITAKIRTNHGTPIAHKIAEHFGGGGHPYAAGFKLLDNKRDVAQLRTEIDALVKELLS